MSLVTGMRSNNKEPAGVVVTGGVTPNSLGIVRSFGRRGIPVVYLDSGPRSIVSYSRYIKQRIKCPSADESEDEFIRVLLDFGGRIDNKMVLICTLDGDVLALSRHKRELEQFYYVPMPEFDTVEKLVYKRNFYRLLAEMGIPHPKTWFPQNLDQVRVMGREIAYPYIVKPSYSPTFQWKFGLKCFVVNSTQDLGRAVDRLEGRGIDVVIQEIIPGRGVYEFFTYLPGESEPLGVCGWDKIRYYPTDFGSGTFCESVWHREAVERGLQFLKAIGYCGMASVELKKDPRDGEYKLLEVNARVTLQHRLAAACGVDIPYIAYRDACGYDVPDIAAPSSGVIWVDDFVDLLPFLTHIKRREVGIGEIVKSLKPGKVHSVLAWDDPAPVIVRAVKSGMSALRLLRRRYTGSAS